MAFLRIENLVKRFDSAVAVDHINFQVNQGEFLTLLGPSGCGKTTTLRCIAGLETPDEGEIYIGERLVLSRKEKIFITPDKRELGMVFQSYAIWPHLTVFDNIAYPLKEKKFAKKVIAEKVQHILEMVRLAGLGDRPATKLSGGQQQRVALARALVYDPKVLLFDEPLSNLDAKLRIEMRNEIRNLQKKLGITSIYVTHDQEEAFALSDRIVVMNEGKIVQIGDPFSLYFKPETPFVAQFIGQTNFLQAIVENIGAGGVTVQLLGTSICLVEAPENLKKGDEVFLSIRPEYIQINPKEKMEALLKGTLQQTQYLGSFGLFYVLVGDATIFVEIHDITESDLSSLPKEGDPVILGFHPKDCIVIR